MAIAIVSNTSASAASGTSKTFSSFDCTGVSALFVAVYNDQVGLAITYNGLPLTLAVQRSGRISWWVLFGPPTGTHDIVASWTNNQEYAAFVVAFSGGATQGILNTDYAVNSNGAASGNVMTTTVTPIQTNSWLLAAFRADDGTNACSTNMTQLDSQAAFGCRDGEFHSTVATVPVVQTGTHNNNGAWAMVAVEYALTGTASTAIKTQNGLAVASVSKINGLAIASRKTWNGLA